MELFYPPFTSVFSCTFMDFPNFFLKLIGFKKRREEKMKSEHVFAFFVSAYRTNISQRRPCRRRT